MSSLSFNNEAAAAANAPPPVTITGNDTIAAAAGAAAPPHDDARRQRGVQPPPVPSSPSSSSPIPLTWWVVLILTVLLLWLVLNGTILVMSAHRAHVLREAGSVAREASRNWADWQAAIPRPETRRLGSVVLVGTHDSGAVHELCMEPPFLRDQPFSQVLPWLPLLAPTINAHSVTQDRSLYEQCCDGMRHFDLRVAAADDGSAWYLWHGFRTRTTLADAMRTFAAFVTRHPHEWLTLWIRVDTPLRNTRDVRDLLDALTPARHVMLRDPTGALDSVSVAEGRGKLLVWMNRGMSSLDACIGDYDATLDSPWANTWEIERVATHAAAVLACATPKFANPRRYFTLQWVVTPQPLHFAMGALPMSLATLAAPPRLRARAHALNAVLGDFLLRRGMMRTVSTKCHAIIGDFFQDAPLLRTIMADMNGVDVHKLTIL